MNRMTIVLLFFSIFSCQNINSEKEMELKERELDLMEKDIDLREKELNKTYITIIDKENERPTSIPKFSLISLPSLVKVKLGSSFEILNDKTADWDDHTFKNLILPERTKSSKYPFIVSGDFDGNKQIDYAVLVANRDRTDNKVVIFLDNGKSYDWDVQNNMGISFFPKQNYTNYAEESVKLKYDAVLVVQFQSYGFLIYWNGKKFETFSTSD